MRRGGPSPGGRLCCRMAAAFSPGYKAQARLARITTNAFVAASAVLDHSRLELGRSVFLGDGVTIHGTPDSGAVIIGERSCLHAGVIVESSQGGTLRVGRETHIQPRCQLSAHKGSIIIGSDVQIAPACGFYPYNHGTALGVKMREQPIESRGDIVIGDDVWIGYGVVVLDHVTIGDGAVVAAGSVVRADVPPNSIAAGVPARVVGHRG